MATGGKSMEPEDQKPLPKKSDQLKKSDLMREIHKLNVQIQAMEREKLTHIFNKRSDFHKDLVVLEEEESKLTEDRKTEKVKVRQQLEKMSLMVKKFQRELREIQPTPEFVEKLKVIMEEIEQAINVFKEQQRLKYEELMRSEKSLSLELQQLEHKFESWSQMSKSELSARPTAGKMTTITKDVTKDLPPEVAAFDKFVHASGGHRGGWDEYDHQTFLKYRIMYKGKITFLDHVKPVLPTRTESEIREHETWYQEYLFLQENKKFAIKKWREKKEEFKEDALSQVQGDIERESKEQKQKIAPETAEEKAQRLKQLNAWKVQKELERAMKEEKKLKEEAEKKRKAEEERKRQLEIKKQVDEFKQQKQLEEEMLEMMEEERKREEAEQRRQVSARAIGKFRNRDMQRLNEKLEKEKEKEEMEREKQRRIEAARLQVHVERDPNRLLKPTAGWKERLKKDESSKSGGQVLHMPHRAIPSWRQGLL